MKSWLRRILRNEFSPILFIVLAAVIALPGAQEARACWIAVEAMCFDVPGWPIEHPMGTGRFWRRAPGPPNWDRQNLIYDVHLCPEDIHSVWCIGNPNSNDPRFDFYPPNLSDYVIYGPINLAQAQAARVSFWFNNNSEAGHDSLWWGATVVANPSIPLIRSQVNLGGGHSGIMTEGWEPRSFDLSNLRNGATGDSVSMLGQGAVYVFWWFTSDANPNTEYHGAFVDNVQISWDDGGVNLTAMPVTPVHPHDSLAVPFVALNDTLMAACPWTACPGGTGLYPAFHIACLLDQTSLLDTVITVVDPGTLVTLYSRPWVVTPDSHHVRFVVDTLNQVAETQEGDNRTAVGYYVPPPDPSPVMQWLVPGPESQNQSACSDTNVWLKWICTDNDTASLILGADNDPLGCTEIVSIPGARFSHPGRDSILLETLRQNDGRVLYPYVHMADAGHDTCQYAPYPVTVHHPCVDDAGERGASVIPEAFFIEQNYPNPFNPVTELRYGIAQGGRVTLTVYDLLGREVALLVNGTQTPGTYRVSFDGANLPSGLYLYSLATPEGTQSRKMMLLK